MTVIAYKDGVMACDSCWADKGTVINRATKIVRTSAGALVGEAGDDDSRAVLALLDKVRSIKQMPTAAQLRETQVDYAALMVLPNGQILRITIGYNSSENGGWYAGFHEVRSPAFATIGCGSDLAFGCLAAGKTAQQAVAITCQYDTQCRAPVHTMELKPAPKSSRQSGSGHAASDLKVINGGLSQARGSHGKRARRTAAYRRRG